MTTHDGYEAQPKTLAFLTPLAPDPIRADRVRVRCRAQLERRVRQAARTAAIVKSAERLFVPAILGALSVFYAAMVVGNALRLEGIL